MLFADALMALGFREACKAGISFGKDDMVVPDTKVKLIDETRHRVREYEQQYQDGLTTDKEKYNLVVDVWSKCTDMVAAEMMKEISEPKIDPETGRVMEMNSIYMMSHSGARGSPQQMKQLAGMRGLMARPDGSIIETPILSNFKEGLTVLEYFNSTHGARKGLADTALKTANSGYLTRRLVDVANDCIITSEDCGTKKGVTVQAEIDGGQVVASLTERILGRTTAEDVKHPDTGEIIIKRNKEVTEDLAEKAEAAHVQKVRVRSVLTCDLPEGVCGKCYGRDLARGTSVNIGEAVGVIAAQSIGEPGTQLTMRTFHIGGAAQVAGQSKIEASYDGKVKIVNRNIVKNSDGELIAMSRNMQIVITDNKGQERATYRITYGARLKVDEGATVKRGDRLAEWNPNALPVLTDVEGTVKYEDLIFGVTVREVADEKTGVSSKVVIDSRGTGGKNAPELRPTIVILDKKGKPTQLPGRRRSALCDFARRHPVGGRRLDRPGRRRHRAYPDRRRQDPRHHRRSAAGGGTVRSPQAQGSGRAGRDRRLCRVRQGLQEQAPRHRQAQVRQAGAERVSDPQGPPYQRARRRLCGEGRLYRRRQSLAA